MTLKWLAFQHSERVAKAEQNMPPFSRNEHNPGVALLQAGLIKFGLKMPITTSHGMPDGIFGSETEKAIRDFQTRQKLKVDGVAGQKTIQRLDELLAAMDKPVPAKPVPPPPPAPAVAPSDAEFKVGTDDPNLTRDAGAGAWDSASTEISMRILHHLMLEPTFMATAAIAIGTDAVLHLTHYNDNSGSDFNIDLIGMIKDVPSAAKLYRELARKLQAYMEKFPAGSWDVTSKRTWGGYNHKTESKNWFFAVGGYSAWIKGRLTVADGSAGKTFKFDGQYKFFDRYNWDGGKSVTIAGIKITDQTMGEFHRQGLSKEYDEYGSCKVRFEWTPGAALTDAQLEPAS